MANKKKKRARLILGDVLFFEEIFCSLISGGQTPSVAAAVYMGAVVTVVHVKHVGCRSCRLFYVNEQIHFHAWLVSGQPVTNGPGASSLSDAKNSSSVIREA